MSSPPVRRWGPSITFSAQAIDTSDNRAVSSASVLIVQAPDTTPPTVGLDAPGTATAGTTITVTATAADDTGVASVAFLLDGTRITTVSDPPYRATVSVPSTLAAGTHLHVEARAADFSGLEGIASRDVNIVAPAAGVITGEVYDDGSGLPVAGASVALLGTDGRGVPYTQTTVSDARGRYAMDAAEGSGVVQITLPGWSVVNRAIAIAPNKGVTVVDARLTATSAGTAIAALPGGVVVGDRVAFLQAWQREVSASEDPAIGQPALGGPDVVLRIPPGALASNATLTLTPLSRQSLPGLLPTGWTPLAIVDIGPHGVPLSNGATLSSPNALNVKAGTPVVFAQWDEQARAWRALASTVLAQDKGALDGAIAITGQYAWVAADVVPLAPPQPATGDLLAGVTAALIPGDASAVVNPQPKILFYKPGVKSDVRGTVTTAGAPLSSGTIVRSRITESYQFRSAGEIHPDPTEQDLVLYQIPGGPLPVMAAGFPVGPSLTFEALSLDHGVITVELRAPEEAVHEVAVIGADGGSVNGDNGQRLDVKAGSATTTVPVEVRTIAAADLGAVLPDGFEFVGAASISFTGTLAVPATWSIPSPAGAAGTDLFLLARLQELGGQTRFVLTGTGVLDSGRLASETALAGTAVTFEGVRTPGRYVFLRATMPLAFAAGSVTVENGAAFAGALITSSTVAVVSLSQATGRYISVVALGGVTVTALDLQKTDTVSAPVTASAPRQVVPLDLGAGGAPADGHIRDTRRRRRQHRAGRSDRRPFLQPRRRGDGDAPDRSPHIERRRGRRHARADGQQHRRDVPLPRSARAQHRIHADGEPGRRRSVRANTPGAVRDDVHEPRHDRTAAATGRQHHGDDSRYGRQDEDQRDTGHRRLARHGPDQEPHDGRVHAGGPRSQRRLHRDCRRRGDRQAPADHHRRRGQQDRRLPGAIPAGQQRRHRLGGRWSRGRPSRRAWRRRDRRAGRSVSRRRRREIRRGVRSGVSVPPERRAAAVVPIQRRRPSGSRHRGAREVPERERGDDRR